MKDIKIPPKYVPITDKIAACAKEGGFSAYAVGGFVRDLIIGRQPKDLDIMVEPLNAAENSAMAGINLSKMISKKYGLREPVVFERFGTSKLFIDGEEVEFVMPRKEYYEDDSRNPDTALGTLEQDALRRDFTVNALFLRLSDMRVLDLTGKGADDLINKIIRVTDPENAEVIFRQDPLRILRAVRQNLQLGFEIEKGTFEAMKANAKRIDIVSPERIRDEINKILTEPEPSKAILLMDKADILNEIFSEIYRLKGLKQPEKYHDFDVFTHTLKVLDRTDNSLVLRMAALLHDTGKYEAAKVKDGKISFHGHELMSAKIADNILTRLKYPKDFTASVKNIIKNHMYPKMYDSVWSDSAVRRFADSCGKELWLVMAIAEADFGKNAPDDKVYELKRRIKDLENKGLLYPANELLSGQELMEYFNLPQGAWIKDAKGKIADLRFDNPLLSKEEAFAIVKEMLNPKK